ncbi:MAG: hypothetical protein VR67_05960 [Peptococcaceae bacterium BRH_c8a]|nr:MAG: hypothetical protein VR67_05960 [Peptococcaceae bacterium BRH_c8a]
MKKNYLILLSLLLLFFLIVGCSTKEEQFDDKNIIFSVINIQSEEEFKSYTIKLTNKTGFELTHLMLNLSYPIKTSNGTKNNPFMVEGKADNLTRPVNLKTEESIQFSIYAPVKEVFSDTDLLDFENPSIELKGYVKEGNKEIPFKMAGGLKVFVKKYF